MKTVQRKNYFLLALAIVYCIIALIQFSFDGILGTQLYFSIAFISLSTTLSEFSKSAIKWIRALKQLRVEIDIEFQNYAKRHIDVLGKYRDFSEITIPYQELYDYIKQNVKTSSKSRWDKLLEQLESVIQFGEVFFILYYGLITPLKNVPNNMQTTKTINILSLLSVALAFFSIYLNESTARKAEKIQEKTKESIRISNYYLDIIEKFPTIQSAETASTEESEEGER